MQFREAIELVGGAADEPGQVTDHGRVAVHGVLDVEADAAVQVVAGPGRLGRFAGEPVGGDGRIIGALQGDVLGGLEPATVPADDWDLNLRLARRGDLAFVDRVVLNWRRHPGAQANMVRGYRWANLTVRRRTVQARDNTPQQREIAILASRGLTNNEIADRLFLSPRTVASHLHRSYPKLGIAGRHQLHGLVGPADTQQASG